MSKGRSAGGSNYHQMKVEGESTKDAITYGVLSGLSEATIQHYLGAIPGLNDVSVTSLKTPFSYLRYCSLRRKKAVYSSTAFLRSILLLIGSLVGMFGSWRAVRKYLKI